MIFDMTWYLNALGVIDKGRTYSHKELIDILKENRPDLSDDMYNWAIDQSTKKGLLSRKGYNAYSLPEGKELIDYQPFYSQTSLDLIKEIQERFPRVIFTVFETVLMNDFLNHLIGRNTIFIQVEKDSSIFVFRYLQEQGYKNLLFNPDKKEIELYWDKDCIIITNLISEAPLRKDDPSKITLEKMLVDMVSDKLISSTFSPAELPEVFEQVRKTYRLDQSRMLRYARRRNKEDKVKKYLEETD
ncbi:MAG: hypothetical protein IJI66_01990 [Erysipelotrichaceae bacterium]|nr:hypothetical protein [Erysipelotrichaceae bacterium]